VQATPQILVFISQIKQLYS